MAPKLFPGMIIGNKEEVPYNGPDPGASYDAAEVPSSMTESERQAVLRSGRGQALDANSEPELNPLPLILQSATIGRPLAATKTMMYNGGFEGTCASINHAGNVIVIGGRNGTLMVIDAHSKETMGIIDLNKEITAAAKIQTYGVVRLAPSCTAVRYLPSSKGASQAMLLVSMGPNLLHVHVSTGKVISTINEAKNEINNVVIRSDGQAFCTTGSDHCLRIYDERTSQLTMTLDHGDGTTTTGHSNDVFGLAWSPDDPNLLVSGGWDHTVQVWDVRLNRSIRSIYGPYVCGDSLDIKEGVVLAGSWRHTSPLELWDLGSCRLMTRLPFHQPELDASMIYAAKFGRGELESCIIAGGSGTRPCVKLFSKNGELIGTMPMTSAVQSIDSVGLVDDRYISICCREELRILDLSS